MKLVEIIIGIGIAMVLIIVGVELGLEVLKKIVRIIAMISFIAYTVLFMILSYDTFTQSEISDIGVRRRVTVLLGMGSSFVVFIAINYL
ncbi:hypothetical protein RAK27_18255 [Carnobacterium maltaromaticum]|uniref:Uncharacterized protein n=1 Tax=Carnobacterium maltaromaticum TaxID=2751 RepID=A0AAW9K472_CARML|nr:hypothetical protein [Carnobacterium maltaromaticum]MDZ5760586.1 hypothetical protein [Carnobacterium maltaromaticum]